MTTLPARDLRTALAKKGFLVSESHHALFRLVVDGRLTSVRTRLSHGERECNDWLLGQIAQQLHLSKTDLLRLVECSLSGEQYAAMMRSAGHVR